MGGRLSDTYFATEERGSQNYLDGLIDKLNIYRDYCESTGKYAKWGRQVKNYYGVSTDGTKASSQVTRGGESGELTLAKVNDFRNLIQHQLILITSQRPAGVAKSITSDPRSIYQSQIASLITEYYLSQVGWEQKFVQTAEGALVCDECFMALEWDFTSGQPIRPNPETGQMIMTGDSGLRVLYPWNVARDPYLSAAADMEWCIYSWRMNKFNLAIKYPVNAKAIIEGGARKIRDVPFVRINDSETDQTTVYCLTHKKSPLVPNGRFTLFVADAILQDIDSPFEEFNVYRMNQNDVMETPFGYSNNSDLLAIEEITDALHSIIMSNQTTFGGQCIIGPKGANFDHSQMGTGYTYFEVDPSLVDKIKPLQLTKSSPELFTYLETLNRKKETLAGINSVVRGDPEGALRSNSGSALALVQAQSLQFNSGGQRSYYQILSKVNTGHIKLHRRYADSERTIAIVGKAKQQFLKEFKYTKDDLSEVSSIVFEPVDATFQSIGGKVNIADNLLKQGMIKNTHQYINTVKSGSLDILTEDDEIMQTATKSENEDLREGKPVFVVDIENHEEHIQSHKAIIATPESKRDPKLVQAVLAHIEEHKNRWQELSMQNPALLVATGQKVLPPPPPMMPQPPPMGTPGGPPVAGPNGPLPQNGKDNLPKQLGPDQPVQHKASDVKQPLMPVNPGTGQRAPAPAPQGM